jgi:hypothetical protein
MLFGLRRHEEDGCGVLNLASVKPLLGTLYQPRALR